MAFSGRTNNTIIEIDKDRPVAKINDWETLKKGGGGGGARNF